MMKFPFYEPFLPLWYPSLALQTVFIAIATVHAVKSYRDSKKINHLKFNEFMVKAGE